MVDFKKMLEERRAKQAAQEPKPNIVQDIANVDGSVDRLIINPNAVAVAVVKEEPKVEQQKQEVAPAQPKKLSFAEIMAQKKAITNASPALQSTGKLVPTPVSEDTGKPKEDALPTKTDEEASLRTGMLDPALESHPAPIPTEAPEKAEEADPTTAQAYADIKHKIEHLESLEDTSLEGAMKDLKKALMANPNAVALMLDTDIGQMVIALRRLKKEAMIEAAKEKKSTGNGKKAKAVTLTAEEIGKVFDEL